MKRCLLSFLVITLIVSGKAIAQDFHKADSSLTVWVNALAKYSLFPCDTIRVIEIDSAKKVMASRIEHYRKSFAGNSRPDGIFPLDSATLHFITEERISMTLLK
jgi:hypothetical protein